MNELDQNEFNDQLDYTNYDYQDLMSKYPILFCQKNKSMQEICMFWGIECGLGWYKQIDELCSTLEELNNDYKKYKVQIQATQIKEKFGGLRFYYNVYFEKTLLEKTVLFPFKTIESFLNKHVDFDVQFEKIVEKNEEQWEEITKKEFENQSHPLLKNDFGWKFKIEGGKYFRNKCVYHPVNFKFYAKKHKFLFKIKEFCLNIRHLTLFNANKESVLKADLLYKIADKLIKNCEEKCWDTCERCGEENNFDKSNIITPDGWISRICKKCSQNIIENETKIFDKNHSNSKYNGIDRITLFREGYEFLNFYSSRSFEYENKYYYSLPQEIFSNWQL